MRRSALLAAAGLALAAAGGAGASPPRHRPAAAADWTRTVVATPEGGYRMGNPIAPVKLVEYGSITCPHCGLFAREGSEALRRLYVRPGKVSWEYRPFLIFPTDPGLFMLLRCAGPSRFFPLTDRLYADQASWADRLRQLPQERIAQINAMDMEARIGAVVDAIGVEPYFRQRGMTPQRIRSCLADQAGLQALIGITRKGSEEGVTGTPAFFVNGKLTPALDWAGLEPLLKSAAG